jgi:uncharacterized membrane protein
MMEGLLVLVGLGVIVIVMFFATVAVVRHGSHNGAIAWLWLFIPVVIALFALMSISLVLFVVATVVVLLVITSAGNYADRLNQRDEAAKDEAREAEALAKEAESKAEHAAWLRAYNPKLIQSDINSYEPWQTISEIPEWYDLS